MIVPHCARDDMYVLWLYTVGWARALATLVALKPTAAGVYVMMLMTLRACTHSIDAGPLPLH